MPLLDELAQFALARDRSREIQPGKLDLTRPLSRRKSEGLEQPVIEGAMFLELKCAQRVRNALNRVRERMSEVIHRVDAPRVSRPVMRHVRNAIDDRIAHDEIRRGHIDLRTQDTRAVRKLSCTHPRKEVKIFLYGAIAPRALLSRLRQCAAIGADFIRREIVHIGEALPYENNCIFIQLRKVIRRVETALPP